MYEVANHETIAFTRPQSAKAGLKATTEMQASADSNKMPSIFQLIPENEPKAESKSREPGVDSFQSKQELVDFLSSNAFSFVNLDSFYPPFAATLSS